MDKEIFDKAADIRWSIDNIKRFQGLAKSMMEKRNEDVKDYAHVLEIMQLSRDLRSIIYDYAFDALQHCYDTSTNDIKELEEEFKSL